MNAKHSSTAHSGPSLVWESGSGYDFFISLFVLHTPDAFGLRPSWASGVRSRLSPAERDTLELAQQLFLAPLFWLHSLPAPRDASTVLWSLRQIPPAERLPRLALSPDLDPEFAGFYRRILDQGHWEEDDLGELRRHLRHNSLHGRRKVRNEHLPAMLDAWAYPGDFGECYLDALGAYYSAFFAEEEKRITPALEAALDRARGMATELPLPELFERLSQGVQFSQLMENRTVIFVPSFWGTPLVFFGKTSQDSLLVTFGARPADASLVPGELVPDELLQRLKALGDPTRLRILRYLAKEPMTAARLSRLLRLRAPTLTHHLRHLRLAGLVYLCVDEAGVERCYETRLDALSALHQQLRDFLRAHPSDKIEEL